MLKCDTQFMTMELDHIFILTERGAPQADLLVEVGIVEGTPNSHPGQGSANRRFFFTNSMLELLYIRDSSESVSGPASGLKLAERLADSNASPFGLVVRTISPSADFPFPGWPYFPEYLGGDKYFHIGDNSDVLDEPLCILLPSYPQSALTQPDPAEPFTTITSVRINVPVTKPSVALQSLSEMERVSIHFGKPHLMEIVFGDGVKKQQKDFRPVLPLKICW
jgi:hypothetical protein